MAQYNFIFLYMPTVLIGLSHQYFPHILPQLFSSYLIYPHLEVYKFSLSNKYKNCTAQNESAARWHFRVMILCSCHWTQASLAVRCTTVHPIPQSLPTNKQTNRVTNLYDVRFIQGRILLATANWYFPFRMVPSVVLPRGRTWAGLRTPTWAWWPVSRMTVTVKSRGLCFVSNL